MTIRQAFRFSLAQPISRRSLRNVPNNQNRYETCDDQRSG